MALKLAFRSPMMRGREMLTMLMSRVDMKTPMETAVKAHHLWFGHSAEARSLTLRPSGPRNGTPLEQARVLRRTRGRTHPRMAGRSLNRSRRPALLQAYAA